MCQQSGDVLIYLPVSCVLYRVYGRLVLLMPVCGMYFYVTTRVTTVTLSVPLAMPSPSHHRSPNLNRVCWLHELRTDFGEGHIRPRRDQRPARLGHEVPGVDQQGVHARQVTRYNMLCVLLSVGFMHVRGWVCFNVSVGAAEVMCCGCTFSFTVIKGWKNGVGVKHHFLLHS